MENKMKKYLGQNYHEENHLLNWLLYWKQGQEAKTKKLYKSQECWRKSNDLDCMYLDDMKADIIVSIFQILQRVIKCINSGVIIHKNKKDIQMIIENFDRLLPISDIMVQKLQLLAEKAELRSNVMLLPDRKMQKRGIAYADEMAPTLYQCFNDGIFSKYFTVISIEEWVEREKLQMAFVENNISRDNIKPTVSGYDSKQSFKRTRKREFIIQVINYGIDFLNAREKEFNK